MKFSVVDRSEIERKIELITVCFTRFKWKVNAEWRRQKKAKDFRVEIGRLTGKWMGMECSMDVIN